METFDDSPSSVAYFPADGEEQVFTLLSSVLALGPVAAKAGLATIGTTATTAVTPRVSSATRRRRMRGPPVITTFAYMDVSVPKIGGPAHAPTRAGPPPPRPHAPREVNC